MDVRRGSTGHLIHLPANSQQLGFGGEARVFAVPNDSHFAAKIYRDPTKAHATKLTAMLANPPDDPMASQGHISIAWPQDLLWSVGSNARVVGFVMPRITGLRIIDYYNPKTRRNHSPLFHYGYLIRTARNVAAAFRALHARGYVIGDVNESNIHVADTALVTLIDTDSFQVKDSVSGMVYRCNVGKPEFTPPELQGHKFSQVNRSPEHDEFGLAVLIFHLLMEGAHPFSGVYLHAGEPPPVEDRIKNGHFPYSKATSVPYRPRPISPPYQARPLPIQDLFQRCFQNGHKSPAARPNAGTWQSTLESVESNLATCSKNAQHLFSGHYGKCPWCERKVQLGGRDPFPSRDDVNQGLHQKPLPSAQHQTHQPPIQTLPAQLYGGIGAQQATPQTPHYPPITVGMPINRKILLVAACVILAIFGISTIKKSITGSGSTAPSNEAPEQLVDRGVCPFEGCKYGEQWRAKQDVDVYLAPPNMVGVPVSSLAKKTVVHMGDWVKTETGIILSKRGEGRIARRDEVVNGRTVKVGEVISIYSYLGEGCSRIWIAGQFATSCSVEIQRDPQNEWWVQIKTADGSVAWTRPKEAFISKEGLNNELAQKIIDPQLPLPRKLAQIDAHLRIGADLNGSGGKYGTNPLSAAINANDVELIQALMSRGLNIGGGPGCIALSVQSSALKPRGDVMLEFLLRNGMQLDCLGEPPIIAFLRFGIATADYSVDRAITVAELLLRHGANVHQRDSQGRSIFDVIDQQVSTNAASRLGILKEALYKMTTTQVVTPIGKVASSNVISSALIAKGYHGLDVSLDANHASISGVVQSADDVSDIRRIVRSSPGIATVDTSAVKVRTLNTPPSTTELKAPGGSIAPDPKNWNR